MYLTIVVLAVASTVETFIPLFGQRLAGLAPLAAGFLGAALALGWTLGEIPSASATTPRIVRRIVVSGPILVAIGLGIMAAFLTGHAGAGAMVAWVIGLLFAGVGIGIAWPHLAVGAMTSVAIPGKVRVLAAINTVQLIANAFGAAWPECWSTSANRRRFVLRNCFSSPSPLSRSSALPWQLAHFRERPTKSAAPKSFMTLAKL